MCQPWKAKIKKKNELFSVEVMNGKVTMQQHGCKSTFEKEKKKKNGRAKKKRA